MAHRWRVTLLDLGLVVFLLFIGLVGTGPAAANQGQTAPLLAYILVLAACLPIMVWRWRPMWTFALVGLLVMVYIGVGYAYGPILLALVVAIYGLAARYPVRRALLSMAVLMVASIVAVGVGVVAGKRDWSEFISVAAWLVIPAAVGVVVKVRRDAAADVRAEQSRRAISEERLQLAQEVHDVVGHGLAVIAMQAGVALRLLERDPARTRPALEAIRVTSQEALDDLRAELEAMRHESGGRYTPRRPTTGLADLAGLAERMSSSGRPVAVELDTGDGGVDDVPVDVDHAAYRIVQESLTNVVRHGGPAATAQIRITRAVDALYVEVLDTGRGAAAPPIAGHGIEGMRERAEALGGTLDAGPRPSGGFAVRARLPCPVHVPERGGSA
jgi:signal transduction histidine kinase